MKFTVKSLKLNAEQVRLLLDLSRKYFPEYRYITIHKTGMMLFMQIEGEDEYVHWMEFVAHHLLGKMFASIIELHGKVVLLTKISDFFISSDPIKYLVEQESKLI
jgi:hypothetical protein